MAGPSPRLPLLTAAVSGLLFGAGLYVSQMINPLKVLRFLDFGAIPSGGWDPSVAFVMLPAVAIMALAVQVSRRRKAPLFASRFFEPDQTAIDRRLVGGAALFGVGWGMSGICPGPALALIPFAPSGLWLFLLAMVAGSWLGSLLMPRERTELPVPA